jgi:hypothetical protein
MSFAPFTVYSGPGGVAAAQVAITEAWMAMERCGLLKGRPRPYFGEGRFDEGRVTSRFAINEQRGFFAIETTDLRDGDFWEAFILTLPNDEVRTGWRRRGLGYPDPPDVWIGAALALDHTNLMYHQIEPDFHLLLGAGSYPQALVNCAYLAHRADLTQPIDLRQLSLAD